MTVAGKAVIAAGDTAHAELAPALAFLQQHCDVDFAESLADAGEKLQAEGSAVFVLAQSRPHQFSRSRVIPVLDLSLATPIVLLGSWCEGETRTGFPWPGARRVYWRDRQGLLAAVRENPLPRTASAEEYWLHPSEFPQGSGTLLISTPHLVDYEGVAAACRSAGYATVWSPRGQPVRAEGITAALWWGNSLEHEHEQESLGNLAAGCGGAPVIALLSFPRPQEFSQATKLGAAEVIPQPLNVVHLLEAVSCHRR